MPGVFDRPLHSVPQSCGKPTHVAIHIPPRSMGKPSTHHNQLKVVVANAPRAIQMCVKESKRMGQSSPPVTADAGLVDGMLMLWGGGQNHQRVLRFLRSRCTPNFSDSHEDWKFCSRHLGPRMEDQNAMLRALGAPSLDDLIERTVPGAIRLRERLSVSKALTESEYLEHIDGLAAQNTVFRNYIGMGYYPTEVPSVIRRNVLENPGWYTAYTPYQAEIAQGRLEALLNFQTMVMDLTGMEVANASLLDEGTAAAEAMAMLFAARPTSPSEGSKNRFLVDEAVYPQTLSVLRTRARISTSTWP